MPTIAEHRGDPLKDYGWILLVLVLFVGGWLSLSSPSSTGGDNIQIAQHEEASAEQSLRSLDSAENPAGAPGGAMEMPGGKASAGAAAGAAAGGGASGAVGSLYQAPGAAAGSPIPEGATEAIEAAAKGQTSGGTSLAEALKGVADSPSKVPDNGWGGATPQSGFAKPKAAFGQIGASRSGGGSSTSAGLVTVDKAFGTGGNVALNLGPGLDGAAGTAGKLAAAAKGANLEGLKAARKTSQDALKQGDEMAVSNGRKSFDGGAAGKGALDQLKATPGGGAGMASDDGVPMNLKANDPSKIDQKKIELPEIKGEEVVDSSNKQQMQQQMMMMMMGMMMMGVMGPAGGQMMGMMMPMMQMGMQMQQQEQLQKDRVKS